MSVYRGCRHVSTVTIRRRRYAAVAGYLGCRTTAQRVSVIRYVASTRLLRLRTCLSAHSGVNRWTDPYAARMQYKLPDRYDTIQLHYERATHVQRRARVRRGYAMIKTVLK